MRVKYVGLAIVLSFCIVMGVPSVAYAGELVDEQTVAETTEAESTVSGNDVAVVTEGEPVEVESTGSIEVVVDNAEVIEAIQGVSDKLDSMLEVFQNVADKLVSVLDWLAVQDVQNYIIIFLVGVIVLCIFMKR